MIAEMQQKGREELAKTSITQSFEGEVEARIQFIYKRDFTIGDLAVSYTHLTLPTTMLV